MSVSLTIDGTAIADGAFLPLSDEIAGAAPTSHTLQFTNSGSDPVVITAVNVDTTYGWMFDVTPPGSLPTLNMGDTMTFSGAGVPLGSLGTTTFASCPQAKIRISYTILAVAHTFSAFIAYRVRDAALTPVTITQDEFADDWIAEYFNLTDDSTISPSNPYGLGAWGINTTGHLEWYRQQVVPSIQFGMINQMWSMIFGHDGSTDLHFDQWPIIRAGGIPLWYDSWFALRNELAATHPEVEVWVYNGNMGSHSDSQFRTLENGCDAAGFADYFFYSMEPYMGWPQMTRFMGDDPYVTAVDATPTNPETTNGEGRFEAWKLVKNLFATNGVVVHVEPRGTDADTQWHSSNGFNRVSALSNYQRTNPAWFGGGGTTNAHCGEYIIIGFAHWQGLPYLIADCIQQGNKVAIGTFDWRAYGRSMHDLYTQTMAHLRYIQGG